MRRDIQKRKNKFFFLSVSLTHMGSVPLMCGDTDRLFERNFSLLGILKGGMLRESRNITRSYLFGIFGVMGKMQQIRTILVK